MPRSPEELAHQEWLGYVQPVGLVVSTPALLEAQCHVDRNIAPDQNRFLNFLPRDAQGQIIPQIHDLPEFVRQILGWEDQDLIRVPQLEPLTDELLPLEVVLPQYQETLRPSYAVPEFRPDPGKTPWLALVQEISADLDLDEAVETDSARHWQASPQAKFERLLRETGVPTGLISNGRQLRLVYAPKGESSGHATFDVAEMSQVAGRPIFSAMHMLLSADRMFSLAEPLRLPAILETSRKYQNTVSTQLAEQVLAALYELMRGFQAANDQSGNQLLRRVLATDPNHVYAGVLTVLMRLVFVMYAEDRDLLSSDATYVNHYSVTGLFNRLREDAGRFPDTMHQRYGAWSQLITLFRLVFQGGQHGDFKIPARSGYLFDPDRFPFLEGRQLDAVGDDDDTVATARIPHVSDGVVYKVLSNLLILNGDRLSYRTLDVEQIGSVYETVMGFNLEVAQGKSIAIKPVKKHGAPTTINLELLLEAKPGARAKLLQDLSDQKLTGAALKELKQADTIEGLLSALDKKVAKDVTPNIVPAGAMIFQPSDERRRSGSHYTPRSLTEPIVRTTLEPILNQLCSADNDLPAVWEPGASDRKRYTKGEIATRIRQSEKRVQHAQSAREKGTPHPSQILDLKICDPAMGSGAFLVEACRQLGDELIRAWYAHDMVPPDIPADEDEVLYARRLVAQRCLYGVDKNVMAVDLAKLSLWLVTLARDHAFTFLDHSLRHGDSLVGLTREQIIGFHWDRKKFKTLLNEPLQKRLDRATEARAKILNAREDVPYKDQEQRLSVADEALDLIRVLGDACVSCFFAESKKKAREEEADRVYGLASSYLESQKQPQVDHASRTGLQEAAKRLRDSSQEHPVPAFHWEIEFPEVFSRENGGFDAFVGNPPFAGRSTLYEGSREGYIDWLKEIHEESHGNADLVAHFFRRTFATLREQGAFGLIATNTIGQGDTRSTGLRWICTRGGSIYGARRRVRWPGDAAVVVSVVHCAKSSQPPIEPTIDGKHVDRITAYLCHAGGHEDPKQLDANHNKSFQGCVVVGMGFTFDDYDSSGVSNSIQEMNQLFNADEKYRQCVFPYIGGEEVNSEPTHQHHRYIINFGDLAEADVREKWPLAYEIVERKVKPERIQRAKSGSSAKKKRAEYWWQFGSTAKDLYDAVKGLEYVVGVSRVGGHVAFTRLATGSVWADSIVIFPFEDFQHFGVLQSRVHEFWARFFSSSMKDDLRYAPTDCFHTFPFPSSSNDIEEAARTYFVERSRQMSGNNEGLTKTYNRFHSPEEVDEGILELRRLHGLMDGAVLRAYGWDDLAESAAKSGFCEFLLDYEEEDEEVGSGQLAVGSRKSKKKKPWRYRWPDDFRDEVLARLLELNEQRHKEELLTGPTSSEKSNTTKHKDATRKESSQKELFKE